jgi:uncharacterized phage infection (PIP) family protein YhgE
MAEYIKNYIQETIDSAITYAIVVNTDDNTIYVSDLTEYAYSSGDELAEAPARGEIGSPKEPISLEQYLPSELFQPSGWGEKKVTEAIKEYESIMARGFKKYLSALDASLYVATPELNNLGFINEDQIKTSEADIDKLAEKLSPIEEKISDITERIKEVLSEDNPDKEVVAKLIEELDSLKASYNQVLSLISVRKDILRRLVEVAKENDRIIEYARRKSDGKANV